jgi:methyl-accepting chemotaxis protein
VAAALQRVREQAAGNREAADTGERGITACGEVIRRSAEDTRILEDRVGQIEETSSLIRDLADQTELLSLNAAIEAARAGEVGKGFNVVALEVQKLAEKSVKAAEGISGLVRSMQEVAKRMATRTAEAGRTVESVRGGIAQIRDNGARAQDAADATGQEMRSVNRSLDEMTNLSLESLGAAGSIDRAFQALRESAQRLAALVEASLPAGPPAPELPAAPGRLPAAGDPG